MTKGSTNALSFTPISSFTPVSSNTPVSIPVTKTNFTKTLRAPNSKLITPSTPYMDYPFEYVFEGYRCSTFYRIYDVSSVASASGTCYNWSYDDKPAIISRLPSWMLNLEGDFYVTWQTIPTAGDMLYDALPDNSNWTQEIIGGLLPPRMATAVVHVENGVATIPYDSPNTVDFKYYSSVQSGAGLSMIFNGVARVES